MKKYRKIQEIEENKKEFETIAKYEILPKYFLSVGKFKFTTILF